MSLFLANFVQFLLLALTVLVFGRVIVSWVDPRGQNQLTQFLYQTTEPLLAPVRRMLPSTGMIDLSPTIVLLILFMLMRAL